MSQASGPKPAEAGSGRFSHLSLSYLTPAESEAQWRENQAFKLNKSH